MDQFSALLMTYQIIIDEINKNHIYNKSTHENHQSMI